MERHRIPLSKNKTTKTWLTITCRINSFPPFRTWKELLYNVAAKVSWSRQNIYRDKIMFVTPKFCRDKYTFVVTKDVFCHDKHVSVMTNTYLPWQKWYMWQLPPTIFGWLCQGSFAQTQESTKGDRKAALSERMTSSRVQMALHQHSPSTLKIWVILTLNYYAFNIQSDLN